MSLPPPTTSFTIPSLHDDLELDCRIYYPPWVSGWPHQRRGQKYYAIIAHPYAPLGGSYDDPVVARVGSALLRNGFLLGTFNFRGAAGSAGRTTWSGRAELGDYVAFYVCMLALIQATQLHLGNRSGDDQGLAVVPVPARQPEVGVDTNTNTECVLVLGGYSYGSLIASCLPPMDLVQSLLDHAAPPPQGSTEFEIKRRADQLARDFVRYLKQQAQYHEGSSSSLTITRGRRGAGSRSPLGTGSALESRMGGYSSEEASRRVSGEDSGRVRRSLDRVRQRLSLNRGDTVGGSDGGRHHHQRRHRSRAGAVPGCVSGAADGNDTSTHSPHTTVAYLLISPLLTPISSLITLFSKPTFERQLQLPGGGSNRQTWQQSLSSSSDEKFYNHPTCIVYGAKDQFTSSKKVNKWTLELRERSADPDLFCAQEVENTGHFWVEAPNRLQAIVSQWLLAVMRSSHKSSSISSGSSGTSTTTTAATTSPS